VARTGQPIAFVGCGYTDVTRHPVKSEVELGVEACVGAAEDAGLDPADLDGINIQVHHYPPPDTKEIVARLGMHALNWVEDGGFGVGSIARAANAVDAGACDRVVVCKIMNTVAPVLTPLIDPETGKVGGPAQFEVPYGLGYTMQRIGLTTRRWMHRYKIRSEQVGWLCATQRQHARLNPHAVFREPLTVDEYLGSRWIADPVRLLDCDYPVNGAYAYVMTGADVARDLRHAPVHLLSWVESPYDVMAFDYLPEELGDGPTDWLREMYRDAGVGPDELDVWMLYDGFSFFAMQWMENLGIVPRGESGNYVEGGRRIRIDGEHPVNTHGGQLSEGRLHGAGHMLEAVQQLRGNAGARQAAKADHAVVTTAFPNTGAAAILGRRDR
jgi:acetyl-CoA acetyltransferase